MYQRHSTISSTAITTAAATPTRTPTTTRYQQNQRSCHFKRRSTSTNTPTAVLNNSSGRRSSSLSSVGNNISFSSLPDVDNNYYNNNHDVGYDDDKYNKRNTTYMSNTSFFIWRILPFVVVLVTTPWVPCYYVRKIVQSKRLQIEAIINEQKKLVTNLDETTAKVKELKLDIEMITKDNELSYQELRRNSNYNTKNNGKNTKENLAASMEDIEEEDDDNSSNKEYEKIEEEEEILVQRIDSLEESIQRAAQKRINKRYGNGQYRFRVNVRDKEGDLSWFIIETAALVEMPHAIDHFFKMVEQQLWNGLSIVHEPHSLIATASPTTVMDGNNSNSHTWAGQRFVDANLTHMAFTEHSPTYPPPHHRLYTVAFSGRPGGPGFYISLENELEYAHEQESTFGVIMEGRDVILSKFFLREKNDSKKSLTIESIDILETKRSIIDNSDSNEEL